MSETLNEEMSDSKSQWSEFPVIKASTVLDESKRLFFKISEGLWSSSDWKICRSDELIDPETLSYEVQEAV